MPRFFVYKLTADTGGAPCVTPDLLSLAICKPSIRSAANLGDWIFGFGDNVGLENRLLYIAEVTGKLTKSAYYVADVFSKRPDCIYFRNGAGLLQHKRGAAFHGTDDDTRKDVGDYPEYRRANVLLSTNFRYFGRAASPPFRSDLQSYIRSLAQGHRSNFDSQLGIQAALEKLRDAAWSRYSMMKVGMPSHTDLKRKCND